MAVKKEKKLEDLEDELERNEMLLARLVRAAKRTKKGDTNFIRSPEHYKKTKMVLEGLKGKNGTIEGATV